MDSDRCLAAAQHRQVMSDVGYDGNITTIGIFMILASYHNFLSVDEFYTF